MLALGGGGVRRRRLGKAISPIVVFYEEGAGFL